MSGERHILVVTGSRGEWGYIRPVLRLIDEHPGLRASLVVTNMHLLPEFGTSRHEIERDGILIEQEIYMALDGYTGATMAKSLGVFLMSITDTIERLRPDFVLLAGDRGEQMMAATAAAHMNTPVAHIQAGEVSGNVDGQTRHALARYAHVHFAANEDAAERLHRSGEQDFRIFTVGAPQLDELIAEEAASRDELAERFHISFDEPLVLLVQHPVTEQMTQAGSQMEQTLSALRELRLQTLLVYPNNDAGSVELRAKIDEFRGPWLKVERNLPRREYAGLLRESAAIVGNSSSGIIEAPAFSLPAVNIGRRQEGRIQGANVVNVDHDRAQIADAVARVLAPKFRAGLDGTASPYGDGHAAERIVRVLAEIPVDEKLLYKALTY
ncbi:MAG TPA: UDP-N-acetylglucosamine 2-epimerase [Gaiellaceae bacterium]|nr:UDP-N-acetylglucosamine 2-epimerase [Gaiellaceae bacterium]